MAFSSPVIDTNDSYGTTVTLDLSVNVAAGDLIVVTAGGANGLHITGIADDDGNSYTLRTELENDTSTATLRNGYVLSAKSTQSPLTITVTWEAGEGSRACSVAVFTPDSGETVSLDVTAIKESGYEDSPWETDSNSSTTGTDEACVAAFQDITAETTSSHEIPSGTAADGTMLINTRSHHSFYTILSATVSNIEAEVDSSGAGRYAAELLCFKSEETSSSSSSESTSVSSSSSSESTSVSSSSSSESTSVSSSSSSESTSVSSSSSSESVSVSSSSSSESTSISSSSSSESISSSSSSESISVSSSSSSESASVSSSSSSESISVSISSSSESVSISFSSSSESASISSSSSSESISISSSSSSESTSISSSFSSESTSISSSSSSESTSQSSSSSSESTSVSSSSSSTSLVACSSCPQNINATFSDLSGTCQVDCVNYNTSYKLVRVGVTCVWEYTSGNLVISIIRNEPNWELKIVNNSVECAVWTALIVDYPDCPPLAGIIQDEGGFGIQDESGENILAG